MRPKVPKLRRTRKKGPEVGATGPARADGDRGLRIVSGFKHADSRLRICEQGPSPEPTALPAWHTLVDPWRRRQRRPDCNLTLLVSALRYSLETIGEERTVLRSYKSSDSALAQRVAGGESGEGGSPLSMHSGLHGARPGGLLRGAIAPSDDGVRETLSPMGGLIQRFGCQVVERKDRGAEAR